MIFKTTPLHGAYTIDLERREDERGFFARSWCQREFAEHGVDARLVQANVSFNRKRGTLRGMHYQVAPDVEAKLVRCTRGAIFDVMVDLRPGSPTHGQWFGVELTAADRNMLYVPEQCAHGFLTLADETEVFYLVSGFYAPAAERGLRYDDPAFGIVWPAPVEVISKKDREWPLYHGQHSAAPVEARG